MESMSISSANTNEYNSLDFFIKYFKYEILTVSLQAEKGITPTPVNTTGFTAFNEFNRVRAMKPIYLLKPNIINEIKAFQVAGYGVYFMVNEGNGVPTDKDKGNLNCGKRSNVVKLKALFIDQDAQKANVLEEKLRELKLFPHLVVQTSPGKHHYYFLLEEVEATLSNIAIWQTLQKFLANIVPELDQTMTDINQILRLPLYHNLKPELSAPHQVTVKKWPDNLKRYNLHELLNKFNLSTDTIVSSVVNGIHNGSLKENYNKFEFPLKPLESGERRNTVTRYIEHLMENVIPLEAKDEDYFVMVDAFINKYLKPEDREEFLIGNRRKNLEDYLRDQRNFRLRKKLQLKVEKLLEEEETKVERLPDEFFLYFPGDAGKIVRELHNYNKHLPKEMAFAAALGIMGLLKCENFRFKGSWPFINGIIIAGTGVGKSMIKGIIERSMYSCGMKGKYSRLLDFENTVQSLHTNLYAAGGAGMMIVDETGDYLNAITSKHAPAYMQNLKKYFKEAGTGADKGATLHPGRSLSFQIPPIYGGMLSTWFLIQPDKFSTIADVSDMSDGFLPRFFVFNGRKDIILDLDENIQSFDPSPEFKALLEGYARLMPYVDTKIVTKEAVDEEKKTNSKLKPDSIRKIEMDAVHNARIEARQLGNHTIQVELTPEAKELIYEYLAKRQKEARAIQKDDYMAPELTIYIRMIEMLNRLICNTASYDFEKKKCIADIELIKACIAFHRFQVDRFFKNELTTIMEGSGESEEKLVLNGIKNYAIKWQEWPTISQIRKSIKGSKRPKNIIDPLRRLKASGEIEELQRDHKRSKKKVFVYKLVESEDVI